jgi:hypothetical protein
MADINQINLTAEPVAIREGEKSTITATVLDNAGAGIKGAEVKFEVATGGKLNPASAKTKKEDGVVTTEFDVPALDRLRIDSGLAEDIRAMARQVLRASVN